MDATWISYEISVLKLRALVLLIPLQHLLVNKAPYRQADLVANFHVKQSNKSSKDVYSHFYQVDRSNMEALNYVKRGEQKLYCFIKVCKSFCLCVLRSTVRLWLKNLNIQTMAYLPWMKSKSSRTEIQSLSVKCLA